MFPEECVEPVSRAGWSSCTPYRTRHAHNMAAGAKRHAVLEKDRHAHIAIVLASAALTAAMTLGHQQLSVSLGQS